MWVSLSDFLNANPNASKRAVVLHVDPSIESDFPWKNGDVIWYENIKEESEDLDCHVVSEIFVGPDGIAHSGYCFEDFRVVPDSEILNFSLRKIY